MTLDEFLKGSDFNQRLRSALLQMAQDHKIKEYEKIRKAGYKKAIEKMENWESNDLSIVYVRNYLEELIDVDVAAPHIDAMNDDEFDKWCERYDQYVSDRTKALIRGKGYQKWFIDKWFLQ